MSTEADFAKYVVELSAVAGDASARKMFGEYGLYLDGKVVGLICDDTVFVKPTASGSDLVGTPDMAPPYPGAKPYIRVDARLDDPGWFAELLRLSWADLPFPRPKKRRST